MTDLDLIKHLKFAHSVADVIGLFDTIDDIHQLIIDLNIEGSNNRLFNNDNVKHSINNYLLYPVKLKRKELESHQNKIGDIELASKKDFILCWILESLDIAYSETDIFYIKNTLSVIQDFIRYLIFDLDLCDNSYVIHSLID